MGRQVLARAGAAPLLALLMAGVVAEAADPARWSAVAGPGFLNAGVENPDGVRFEVSCPFGQSDRTPQVFIDGPGFRLAPGSRQAARIFIDGNPHVLSFEGGVFRAGGREARNDLEGLLKAMIVSKARLFVVEFPDLRRKVGFSLLGSATAIDSRHGWLLDQCPP